MNEENQNFADYVSKLSDAEVIYDSEYNSSTFNSESASSATSDDINSCNLNSCNLDDGKLTCGDDFADNGETIQGGPCQDLREYFSDKPYLD